MLVTTYTLKYMQNVLHKCDQSINLFPAPIFIRQSETGPLS